MSEPEGENDKKKTSRPEQGTEGGSTTNSRVTLLREGPFMEWKKAHAIEPKRSADTEEDDRTKPKEEKEKKC